MIRLALCSLLLVPGALHAQTANPPVTLRFQNGSIVQQATMLDSIEMETKLGKLTIPANEIQRIDFGFRVSDEDAKKLAEAMRDLKSDKHASREMATKTLLGLGKLAYPTLLEHRKGGDLEMTRRVEALIKDITAKFPAGSFNTRRTDIVRTSDSVLSGVITSTSLKFEAEIFGELKVPLWRLRDVRSAVGEVFVTVDASKYGNRNTWMTTEFDVQLDSKIDIHATGEINVDPNNQIGAPQARMVRPDGTNQLGSGEPYLVGVLLGRVGNDGPIFVIGSNKSVTPNREGKLQLRIVTLETGNGIRAEGNYQVRITAELGGGGGGMPAPTPPVGKGKKFKE
jgi:hypothetical protein